MEESIRKYERDQKDQIMLAWLNAAWQRSKKMPDINKVLESEKPEQDEDEMIATVKKINAKMGGRIF
jgi:hypothetical protein